LSLSIFKTIQERDRKYLEFIITKPCLVDRCGVANYNPGDGLIVYHHVRELGGGGTALKPSDYKTIPLCAEHHNMVHFGGLMKINLDIEYVLKSINGYLIEYIAILQEMHHESKKK